MVLLLKNKLDIHYVYCNVTGSNDGTSKDPNFQLNMFFEKCIFPVIDTLVCDGGPFEGFDPVIEGDNADPHHDARLYKYVVNFYKAKKNDGGNLRDIRCPV